MEITLIERVEPKITFLEMKEGKPYGRVKSNSIFVKSGLYILEYADSQELPIIHRLEVLKDNPSSNENFQYMYEIHKNVRITIVINSY